MAIWNPWHGCKKISPGCQHCYVYRRDAEFGKDSSIVTKTGSFDLPIKKNRQKEYKLMPEDNPIYTCMTSDFFIKEADEWRPEIWKMIRLRSDLHFIIITKRIDRFEKCIPDDWGEGYENVTICCTCENQSKTNYRLPIFIRIPAKHKEIIHEPMLEEIHIEKFLASGQIEQVTCGGESGDEARLMDFAWALSTMNQCVKADSAFYFKQTGALFRKGNKIYHIDRKDQMEQARKAGIDYLPENKSKNIVLQEPEGEQLSFHLEPASQSGKDRFERLGRSKFRSSFYLKEKEREYVKEKGLASIEEHARDFVAKRLSPADIPNDGKQTPMRGHPVFIAQHATATCCRGCLKKWHGIEPGRELTEEQQDYITAVLMEWIRRQMKQ